MSLYPESVARCQHIKVNGMQCGSPALRDEKYCFFHMRWCQKSMEVDMNCNVRGTIKLQILEDANSIQVQLAEVMRLLVSNQIDHRTAALLLYALQTASVNQKHTSFEPEPTHVVIDRECVERRPIGATAWSTVEGCEYDDVAEKRDMAENKTFEDENDDEGSRDSVLKYLIDRKTALYPELLDMTIRELRGRPKKESVEN